MERSAVLTLSHVVGRSDAPEFAKDIGNTVLLDWTHYVSFDAGLRTFDESR